MRCHCEGLRTYCEACHGTGKAGAQRYCEPCDGRGMRYCETCDGTGNVPPAADKNPAGWSGGEVSKSVSKYTQS